MDLNAIVIVSRVTVDKYSYWRHFTNLETTLQILKIQKIPAVGIHDHILLNPLGESWIAVPLRSESSYHHFLAQVDFNPAAALVRVPSVTGRPAR